MSLPKCVYNAGGGDVTVQCVRGPVQFMCSWKSRVHDNVATSGLRERVVEGHDLMLSFVMPALTVGDDYDDWALMAKWLLGGGSCKFYPNAAVATYHNCVTDDDSFEAARVGVRRYSATFRWRIVPDAQAPTGPAAVMAAFLGVS